EAQRPDLALQHQAALHLRQPERIGIGGVRIDRLAGGEDQDVHAASRSSVSMRRSMLARFTSFTSRTTSTWAPEARAACSPCSLSSTIRVSAGETPSF